MSQQLWWNYFHQVNLARYNLIIILMYTSIPEFPASKVWPLLTQYTLYIFYWLYILRRSKRILHQSKIKECMTRITQPLPERKEKYKSEWEREGDREDSIVTPRISWWAESVFSPKVHLLAKNFTLWPLIIKLKPALLVVIDWLCTTSSLYLSLAIAKLNLSQFYIDGVTL